MDEEIEEIFNICFNDDKVKTCGRLNCIKLIISLEKIFPGVDFGNKKTGFMNIENILKYKRLNK